MLAALLALFRAVDRLLACLLPVRPLTAHLLQQGRQAIVESDVIRYNAAIVVCGMGDARRGATALFGTMGQACWSQTMARSLHVGVVTHGSGDSALRHNGPGRGGVEHH